MNVNVPYNWCCYMWSKLNVLSRFQNILLTFVNWFEIPKWSKLGHIYFCLFFLILYLSPSAFKCTYFVWCVCLLYEYVWTKMFINSWRIIRDYKPTFMNNISIMIVFSQTAWNIIYNNRKNKFVTFTSKENFIKVEDGLLIFKVSRCT